MITPIDYINVETNSSEDEQEPREELGRIFEEDSERSSEREEEINNDLLLIDRLGDMWDIGNDIDF